jgi:hypothetical protein
MAAMPALVATRISGLPGRPLEPLEHIEQLQQVVDHEVGARIRGPRAVRIRAPTS